MADADDLVRGIDAKTKEQLDEKKKGRRKQKDIFRGETVDCSGDIDDRIIARQGLIRTIRRF